MEILRLGTEECVEQGIEVFCKGRGPACDGSVVTDTAWQVRGHFSWDVQKICRRGGRSGSRVPDSGLFCIQGEKVYFLFSRWYRVPEKQSRDQDNPVFSSRITPAGKTITILTIDSPFCHSEKPFSQFMSLIRDDGGGLTVFPEEKLGRDNGHKLFWVFQVVENLLK